MGCIRVDKITEYVCEPLRKCLKDEDPYVRKTAAVCVAKLHDINAQLVEDQGFLDMLRDLLSDSNPMVSGGTSFWFRLILSMEKDWVWHNAVHS
jgi:AP-1 complex subunit beta-1